MGEPRPITIAILAMGGEGGGVLADWLVQTAEHGGYLAQTTSVPGVAQRTGATIYYLEMFPRSAMTATGRPPVMALMPVPGDTDIVIASELMEAGRAIQRGLVTPGRTTLVASTHRVYSLQEKMALADGRVSSDALLEGCTLAAKCFIGFDMIALAERHQSVISAVMLGALAGAGILPFSRDAFEGAIRAGGISVENSLKAFADGFSSALATTVPAATPDVSSHFLEPRHLLTTLFPDIPCADTRSLIEAGVERTCDFQDIAYAEDYLRRLTPFIEIARDNDSAKQELLAEVARHLALGMTYEDAIRVAELKIRPARFDRIRKEARLRPEQILRISEFMHPRVEEIADILPARLGRWLLRPHWMNALLRRLTSRGRTVTTTSLSGFMLLFALASRKKRRRATLRFYNEGQFLDAWLAATLDAARHDVRLACRVAQLRGLVKGYGDTYARGHAKYDTVLAILRAGNWTRCSPEQADDLLRSANADESGETLNDAIRALGALRTHATASTV